MPLEKLAFVVPDLLAGCKYPDAEDDETLKEIAGKFKTLISLTETPHPAATKLVQRFGLKQALHLPISDFSTPTESQIRQFCSILLETKSATSTVAASKTEGDDEKEHPQQQEQQITFINAPILLHCHLGAGRTGTMLSIGIAAFFTYFASEIKSTSIMKNDSNHRYAAARDTLLENLSEKNFFETCMTYHKKVRPQSIMTTRQTRFLEEFFAVMFSASSEEESTKKRTDLLLNGKCSNF